RVGEPAIGLRAPAAERTAAAAGRGDARHPRAVSRVNGFAAQHALGGADALVADVDLRPRDQLGDFGRWFAAERADHVGAQLAAVPHARPPGAAAGFDDLLHALVADAERLRDLAQR